MTRFRTAGGRAPRRLALALWALSLAAVGVPASAQTIPTGYQDYYVLGNEQHVWLLLNRVITGEGGGYTAGNGMNSVVSAVAMADGQRLFYDHWEDGLEADILNPVQATTWILGDGNVANGNACLWTTTACVGDLITQGMEITLDSNQGLQAIHGNPALDGCAFAGTANQIRCSVPVNPRCTVGGCVATNNLDIRFDGGDRIVTSGGPISFVHNQDPKCAAGCATANMTIIGGATEVLSKQAFQNATSYSVPIGESLWTGNGTAGEPFQYAALDLMAFEDNTTVVIGSPGSGVLTITLNRGEHFTSCDTWTVAARNPCLTGQITGATRDVNVTPTITLNAGTKISTSGPISGLMFSAGDATFATHFMPLLPDLLHGTDYMIPSIGDDLATGPAPASRPTNHYLFNPDPDNSVIVSWIDTGGTGSVTIPPNSTVNYCAATGRAFPGCVPANSTVRLTSNRRFWGVTIHDHENVISDWAYAWLATRFLSTEYTMAYSPGTRQTTLCAGGGAPPCNSHNRAPAWVTATQDNTLVRIDLDGDAIPDFVDTDGDGCPNNSANTTPTDASCEVTAVGTCPAVTPGRCVYEVDTLQSLRVYDYTDMTNTGTRIRASRPVAVVYGQDTAQGESGDETPDTGYIMYPALQAFLDPVFTLDKAADRTTVPTAGPASGRVVTYTLTLRTYEFGPLDNVTALDLLPPQVTLGDAPYVVGSTLITYPDLFQSTADPTVDTTVVNGQTRVRLTWDLRRTPPTPYSMSTNETLTIRYRITIPSAGAPRSLINEARASATYGGSTFNPRDTAEVVQTDATLFKASADDGSPQPGDLITYTLYVRNLGAVNETGVIVTDAVPADTTFVTGSITGEGPFTGGGAGAYLAASNAIRWGGAGGVTLTPLGGTAIAGTTLAFSGTTATATTPAPHNWASGVPVTISGAGAPYDGTFTITVTGPTTFTYVMSATPGASSSGTATGPYRLTFQVQINPGVADGTFIPNRGGYESVQTPYFLSNEVNPQVVGPALDILKWSEPETVRSVTSLTRSGTTATVTTSVAHGWITGEVIRIAGATQSAYNGNFAITVTGANTFTYQVSGSPATPATGTITATGPTVAAAPGQVITFHVRARNTGTGSASNLRIDDQIPANTTYVAGSMAYSLNSSAYTALTDASDLDQGTVPTAIALTGITQAAGVATATSAAAHGLSVGQLVEISGASIAGYNGSFVIASVPSATTFTFIVPASTPTPNGAATATRPRFVYGTLGPGEDIDFRFQVRINPGTNGLFVNNQATVSTTELPPRDTNLVTIPIIGTVTITGHVWLDLNSNGIDPGAGEPDIANVDVVITDVNGNVQIVTTDASGNWSAVVPAGATSANVDETDPDFPAGATETTAPTDGQVRTVPAPGPTVWNVGYVQPPIVIQKRSSAGGTVLPGQRVAYTVTVTNTTGVVQTGVNLADVLPPGTTLVPGTAGIVSAATPAIRVTEYYLDGGATAPDLCVGGGEGNDFANLVCTLDLNQALAADYFVIVQGSETGGADRGPNSDYVSVTDDPFGTGDFPGAGLLADQIRLTRSLDAGNWQGVVTVVECIAASCATDPNGFRLLDVQRVAHGAAAVAGTDTLTAPVVWSDLSRVMLVGGANGAGCDSADADVLDHNVCHPRLFPSGTNTINWSRDAAGSASLGAATSTVMAVQWGSAWNVQRTSIVNGNAGGDGLDQVGEYNTVNIDPIRRAQTWVWGTGHTNDRNTGSSAEGVALTLGNGVSQNPTESRLAAGIDEPGNAVSFDVYALTHPQLAVDHRFLIEGNAGVGAVNTAVNAATTATARMALVYNGLDDQSNDYPAPLAYARYAPAGTSVDVVRRRPGTAPVYPFAAWLQGIDFSQIRQYDRICANTAATCYTPVGAAPSNVILGAGAGANGVTIPALGSLTFVYQVDVNDPLAAGISVITNTATETTTQNPAPRSASVTDNVIRLSVDLEPNNAVFALRGTSQTFTHDLVNTGGIADSYDLTFRNDRGWAVELLDDATGAVIAADLNGDGIWDCGCNINTGTVQPGASVTYRLRVAVPAGAPFGQEGTTTLTATSTTNANVSNDVRDEIRVLDVDPTGPVALLPDNSGVVTAGSYAVYAHRVVNNTGVAETFDLYADSTLGWSVGFHWDANGDGVYTPGVDQRINNTQQLAQGASQLVFVVVNAPPGTPANTREVTHLTARRRTNPDVFDGASDTTTVVAATSHDLSGGGTRVANPGDVANHPGTILNLRGTADTFEIAITPANLFGVDGLNHPSALHVDKNGDGVISGAAEDTPIAVDTDGDGDWDTIDPAYSLGGSALLPDIPVAAGATVAYELRRQVDANMVISRDFVSLTATSLATGESDNVTGTVLLAVATRARLGGLRVDVAAGVIEFSTLLQQGTLGFNVYETDAASLRGTLYPLNRDFVAAPFRDSLVPILYRVEAGSVTRAYIVIEELEVQGTRRLMGPFAVGDTGLARGYERALRRMERAGVPEGAVRTLSPRSMGRLMREEARERRGARALRERPRPRPVTSAVKVEVETAGIVEVPLQTLREHGLLPEARRFGVWSQGRSVPSTLRSAADGTPVLAFAADALGTDYAARNAYVVTHAKAAPPLRVPLTRSSAPATPGAVHVEKSTLYVAHAPQGGDPWLWDYLTPEWGEWPYAWWDPTAGNFDIPGLVSGITGPVAVRIRVLGFSEDQHQVRARINGQPVGELVVSGTGVATLEGSVMAETLLAAGNVLGLDYAATALDSGDPNPWAVLYLDALEIDVPTAPPSAPARVAAIGPYAPELPGFAGVRYLVITHRHFLDAATRVAALKEAEGLKTEVVTTDQAYDHFSAGVVEARAIQALVAHAKAKSPKLGYVLLVGDDSFDPNDYTGAGASAFVPSLLAWDGEFGRVASENRYADVDGDGSPDVAIGRLPVQTPEEAALLVTKISGQGETLRASAGRQLFVTDDSSGDDAPFREQADAVAEAFAPTLVLPFADATAGADSARSLLQSGWTTGAAMTHYFGHGGPTMWADEQVLSVDTAASLTGSGPATVLFAWACLSQYYQYLWGPSINEALLLQPAGGALASFGPAGISSPGSQQALIDGVYRNLRPGVRLGELIRRAKAEALQANPNSAHKAVEGFNLIGDPALVLP